jgi:hypothetical protein
MKQNEFISTYKYKNNNTTNYVNKNTNNKKKYDMNIVKGK